jgi:hypothetical protein
MASNADATHFDRDSQDTDSLNLSRSCRKMRNRMFRAVVLSSVMEFVATYLFALTKATFPLKKRVVTISESPVRGWSSNSCGEIVPAGKLLTGG